MSADADDDRLAAHDLEQVADVGQQDREVDDREADRGVDETVGHVVGFDGRAGPDREDDRAQEEGEHRRVHPVSDEDVDDARRVAVGSQLDAQHHDDDHDRDGDALGGAEEAHGEPGGHGIRRQDGAEGVVAVRAQRVDRGHHRDQGEHSQNQGDARCDELLEGTAPLAVDVHEESQLYPGLTRLAGPAVKFQLRPRTSSGGIPGQPAGSGKGSGGRVP